MASTDTRTATYESVTIDDVIVTVVMARVTDFFGFFVYAIASALIFPKIFFPFLEPVSATLMSFAVFSLAFLARPIAGALGRPIQRKIGRAGKITFALMLLGTSTVAIGLLPGYEKIGILAPVLLAALRFVQGLGLGGAWDGITMQLKTAAPEGHSGRYGMIAQLGGPIGFIVAAALFYVLTGFLTVEELYSYGWRFAFFAVMAVNVVSLFARLRLLTTEFGSDDDNLLAPNGVVDLVVKEWRTIILSALLPLSSYAMLHMVTVFPLSYTLLFTDHSTDTIILWQILGAALATLAVIASGVLSDMFTKRGVLIVSCALVPLVCLTIGTLDTHPEVFILLGFVVLGLAYGQSSSIIPNRFNPAYRYSGSASATNLSWILGAAFAPLIGLFLANSFGLWAASLYMLSGAIVTALSLYLLEKQLSK